MRYIYILLGLLLLCSCSEKVDNGGGGNHAVDQFVFYGEPFQGVPSVDDMRIYSLSPRAFAKENALQVIRTRLDSIQMLNVNVIWILPIFLKSETRVPYGSPYSMRDFYKIDPEYGTVADLRELVKEAHSRGMAVILDLITKHTGSDAEWIKTHPEWYKMKDLFTSPGFTPESYTYAAELDWTNPEVTEELIRLMKYWVAVANIDGYRCDTARRVPEEIWSEAIDSLRNFQEGRKIIMLAEVEHASYLEAGFDLNYGWPFRTAMVKVFDGTKSVKHLFNKHTEELDSTVLFKDKKARMRFSTSHDYMATESPLTKFNSLDGSYAAFVIAITMGGVPMIYSSQEIGYPVKLSFFKNNAVVMDWDSNTDVFRTYCKFMEIAGDPVLRLGSLTRIENDDVVSFVREYEGRKILVLVNVRSRTVEFNLSEEYRNSSYIDMMTGMDFGFTSNTLSPYEYHILKFR